MIINFPCNLFSYVEKKIALSEIMFGIIFPCVVFLFLFWDTHFELGF